MEPAGTITISESIGKVSYLVNVPEQLKAVIVLAHGAGAGMTHQFMEALSTALADSNIGTVRYNFPYMEKKSKRPDMPAVAEKTVEVVSTHVQKLFPGVPLFLGGKSFGGRMSSQYISKKSPEGIKGIVFYGFPLHAPGAPSIERAAHLKSVRIPMLFLQGTRDALADLSLMEKVCSELPLATLVKFEGADHSFKVKKSDLIPPLASRTATWIENV
jgi:uncharacterized protein